MQYHEYIANENARREREVQLASKYNQQPTGTRKQNLWMVGMERHSTFKITGKEFFEVLIGMGIVAAVLVASIVLG